jgi:hypothetical protein
MPDINFKLLSHGRQLSKLFKHFYQDREFSDKHIAETVEELLIKSENRFLENKNKKWIISCLGFILAGFFTYVVSLGIYELENSYYDRIKFDSLLDIHFGDFRVKDAVTDDIFLISYSYNLGKPRFYTKYNALDPALESNYDVQRDFAAAATSATPLVFDPVTRYTFENRERYEEFLVDGDIIANNPALYATLYAKNTRGQQNVRVFSIGFKTEPEKTANYTYMNTL